MAGKRETESIRYYINKGKRINIGKVMYVGEWVNLELGLFTKEDVCPSGVIIKEYGTWYHILKDGKAYYTILKENGVEITFYSPINTIDYFAIKEEKSYNILAETKVTIFNVDTFEKIELEMSHSQFLSVYRYFTALNIINKSEPIKYNNQEDNHYLSDIFEDLIFRLLVKEGDYDEVIRPTQNKKDKNGIDIIAYKHVINKGIYLFECKNTHVFPQDMNKLNNTIEQEKATKGFMVSTREISSSAQKKATELGIEIISRREQLESLRKSSLIRPLMITELIKEEKRKNYNRALLLKKRYKEFDDKVLNFSNTSRKFTMLLNRQISEWQVLVGTNMIGKNEVLKFYHDLNCIPKEFLTLKFDFFDIAKEVNDIKRYCTDWLAQH